MFSHSLIPITGFLLLLSESSAIGCGYGLKRSGVPRIENAPCTGNTSALDGTEVFCGMLIVSERSLIYKRRTIKLPMLRICPKNRRGLTKRSSPIVHLHGGPGSTVVKDFNSTATKHFSHIAISSGRDVILYDQRGSVITKPMLNCSEPFPITRKCIAEIASNRIDLTTYNTRNNAKDIDDLRKVIGATRLNVYGNSYGTILAQAYARAFKSRIRSMVLTGATWPSFDLFMQNSPRSFELVVGRQIHDCKRDFNCSRKYPNLQNDFDKLVNLPLDKKDLSGTFPEFLSTTRNAVLFYMSLVIRTISVTESVSLTPVHISTYAEFIRNPDRNSSTARKLILLNNFGAAFNNKIVPKINSIALQTVNCYDHQGIMSDLIEERVNGGLKSRIPLTLITPAARRAQCRRLPLLNPPIKTSFFSHDIPTLVLSGSYDVQTPTDAARKISRSLQNARLVEFSGLGHSPLYDSSCAVDIYLKFLRNPNGKRFEPLPCIRDVKPKLLSNFQSDDSP